MTAATAATPTRPQAPRFLPAGDSAAVMELGTAIDPAINAAVHRWTAAIERAREEGAADGVAEVVPAYASLTIHYDPRLTDFAALRSAVLSLAPNAGGEGGEDSQVGRLVELPTQYGGADGPDLPYVAQNAGMSEAEVVEIHSSADYLVYAMGFSPGFPYLGGLDPRLAAPRLPSPRTLIPAGSVGIAETQTGVYPVASPGGWRLIGRTRTPLFDPTANPPATIAPGDRVRFVPA